MALGSTGRLLDINRDGTPMKDKEGNIVTPERDGLKKYVADVPDGPLTEIQMMQLLLQKGVFPEESVNQKLNALRQRGAFSFVEAAGTSTEATVQTWLEQLAAQSTSLAGRSICIISSNPHVHFQTLVVTNTLANESQVGLPQEVSGCGYAPEKVSVDLALQTIAKILHEEVRSSAKKP